MDAPSSHQHHPPHGLASLETAPPSPPARCLEAARLGLSQSALERPLRLLLYFDIFHHPLSFQEIHALGYPAGTPAPTAEAALRYWLDRGDIQRKGDFYFPAGRETGVALRLTKAQHSRLLWRKVPAAAKVLSSFPFVRGLLITGTLSKDAAGPGADIDFLVFTRANRVWICRSLIATFRKLLPHDLRQYVCANVFVAEDALEYAPHNIYIAMEIALSRPVLNPGLATRFIRSNRWLMTYLPGIDPEAPPDDRGSAPTGWLEQGLEGRLGDWLEDHLARSWERFWARKYTGLTDDERGRRFRVERNLSTNHFHDFQVRTLEAYRERLERHGLEPEL